MKNFYSDTNFYYLAFYHVKRVSLFVNYYSKPLKHSLIKESIFMLKNPLFIFLKRYLCLFMNVTNDCGVVHRPTEKELTAGRPGQIIDIVQVEPQHLTQQLFYSKYLDIFLEENKTRNKSRIRGRNSLNLRSR